MVRYEWQTVFVYDKTERDVAEAQHLSNLTPLRFVNGLNIQLKLVRDYSTDRCPFWKRSEAYVMLVNGKWELPALFDGEIKSRIPFKFHEELRRCIINKVSRR